ncbi:MAG: hypothetical protein AB7K64_06730 [Variibacter sp.]
MSARETAWLEHQRRRFMRPDAERYWRPDAARFMTPEAARQLLPPSLWPVEPQSSNQVDAAEEVARQREYDIELAQIKSDFAALRFEIALAKRAKAECKENFNPDQPRIPAGNPDGGQWTYGDGAASDATPTDISGARRLGSRPHGHHFVSHSVYSKLPLRPETRKVFDEAKTGRLHGDWHGWDRDHQDYNLAVKEALEKFMADRRIQPEQMTPDQAHEFVNSVKRSSDLRIRRYNVRIYMREIMYWMRRGPRVEE